MNDSTPGTRTLQTSFDPSSEPIVNSENEAGWEVLYSASAAAFQLTITPSIMPANTCVSETGSSAGIQPRRR